MIAVVIVLLVLAALVMVAIQVAEPVLEPRLRRRADVRPAAHAPERPARTLRPLARAARTR